MPVVLALLLPLLTLGPFGGSPEPLATAARAGLALLLGIGLLCAGTLVRDRRPLLPKQAEHGGPSHGTDLVASTELQHHATDVEIDGAFGDPEDVGHFA